MGFLPGVRPESHHSCPLAVGLAEVWSAGGVGLLLRNVAVVRVDLVGQVLLPEKVAGRGQGVVPRWRPDSEDRGL